MIILSDRGRWSGENAIAMTEAKNSTSARTLEKQNVALALIDKVRLSGAEHLDLAWKGLESVPESVAQLTHLTHLSLAGNQLAEFPKSIEQLSRLEYLNLSQNQLENLPDSVSQLNHLRTLDVSNNHLVEISESIGLLTQLEQLSLSRNQLKELPESIGNLFRLMELTLSHNPLSAFPDSLGKLTELRHLEAYYGSLAKLPDSLGQCSKLRTLYLLSQKLTKLPESIGQLTQLKQLDVSGNQLLELPQSIGSLSRLEGLDISRNQLTKLPRSIGQLSQLRKLDISDNQLTELAESLENLSSLKEFYLSGNPALGLPAEILGSSQPVTRRNVKPGEVLQYYLRVRLGKRPLNEAKLILIGRGAVGKTSIVNRLVHNRFQNDEAKTEGIQITEWKLKLRGKEKVRLNIWDFGGQEIMHATHQFFLTKRSLYLVVLNGREGGEDADAEYWLKLVETFGGESPIIVVLNKILEHPFDLNRRALQKKYPAIKHFIKTDCRHEIGLEELRRLLELETDRLDHLRDAFPASWFGIKDQLSAMKTNYFSFEEYRKLCDGSGESDPAAQDALASYLHNLGIVLNYRDDPRLHDTHVLNPHWVTNGIYKILNSERLERQKGEIRLNEFAEILDPTVYPLHMCRFIVDLMKKFDLCFSFPDNEFHFLIPELLDKQEPPEAAAFKPEECLNLQYDYPVLPEGLLPRFIVRTHALSELPESKRWRTGVILKFEKCRALVKADVQDKKIFISVLGPQSDRRRLLAIVRADLGRIHRDLHNLQPREMIPVPKHPDVVIPYDDLILWESNNRAIYSVRAAGKIIDLHVQDLLNGVDLEFRGGKLDEDHQPLRLFYSYSQKDESLRDELETQLKLMNRQQLISSWHDRNIEAGNNWKREINENLERADIILLLISPDFIASDYCYEVEMKRAMERHKKEEARVIPIIVRDVSWTQSPFSALQALPRNGKAITLWENKDSAWRTVSEEIERVINAFERT